MMKKLIILFCGAVLLGFVSCNSKEATPSIDPLLGSWISASSGVELVFYPSGIYVLARPEINETGQYWRSDRSSLKFLPKGSQEVKTSSYSLSSDRATLKLNGGAFSNTEFRRIEGGVGGN